MANQKMEEIKTMFAERMNLEEVKDNQSLKDLGLDSLDVVEMCLDLEEKYGIQFTTEELTSFKTIGDLFNSIEKKLGE